MLTVSSQIINRLERLYLQDKQEKPDEKIDTRAELGVLLQHALELEHSTIPPYLAAAYSLDKNKNKPIRDLIMRIAKEEMLHMTVVANLMNAIGVAPQFTNSQFIPQYPYAPSMLSMPGFKLNIQSFSRDEEKCKQYVRDFFMKVEASENPEDYPVVAMDEIAFEFDAEPPKTIGLFYKLVIDVIREEKIPGLFDQALQNAWKQVVVWLPSSPNGIVRPKFGRINVDGTLRDYPLSPGFDLMITDKDSAVKFLNWVVDQGEGTTQDPINAEGLAAHYYRFESIVKGKYLIVGEQFPQGYAHAGTMLKFDTADGGIWEFDKPNPKEADYQGRLLDVVHKFNMSYSNMLRAFQDTFNAATEEDKTNAYGFALSEMTNLPILADAVRTIALEEGKKGGLPFEYVPPAVV